MQEEKTLASPIPDQLRSDVNPNVPPIEEPDEQPPVMRHHEFLGWDRRTLGVPVFRRTKERDHAKQQLKLYSPCSCGSGKNYKFCCKGKDTFVLNTDAG